MSRKTKRLHQSTLKAIAIVAFGVASFVGVPAIAAASETQPHVVDKAEIQARIDQRTELVDADRQAISVMLQSDQVRDIAGSAGLDLERASAAAATLSGPELENLAAQARVINSEFIGGDQKIVLTTTGIIIILLILILLVG